MSEMVGWSWEEKRWDYEVAGRRVEGAEREEGAIKELRGRSMNLE